MSGTCIHTCMKAYSSRVRNVYPHVPTRVSSTVSGMGMCEQLATCQERVRRGVQYVSRTCSHTCKKRCSLRIRNEVIHVYKGMLFTCHLRVSTRERTRVLLVLGPFIYTGKNVLYTCQKRVHTRVGKTFYTCHERA